MELKVGKYIVQSTDDRVLEIYKERNLSQFVWKGAISDIEITYYLSQKTFTRVPSLIIAIPEHNTINFVSRYDKGEIQIFRDYLVKNGAIEKLHNIFIAGGVQHSSVKEQRIIEKQEKKEKQKEEKKLQRKLKGEQAIKNLELQRKRTGCKEMKEEKYTCTVCNAVWYSNDMDKVKNIHNAMNFSNYSVNQMRDISRCPKCGSKASTHKTVRYWVDKKGNCVDREE